LPQIATCFILFGKAVIYFMFCAKVSPDDSMTKGDSLYFH